MTTATKNSFCNAKGCRFYCVLGKKPKRYPIAAHVGNRCTCEFSRRERGLGSFARVEIMGPHEEDVILRRTYEGAHPRHRLRLVSGLRPNSISSNTGFRNEAGRLQIGQL